MKGMWKKKSVDYTPGRLIAAVKKNVDTSLALKIIEEHGGRIEHISPDGILDVSVSPRDTLKIASLLGERVEFRFVSPEIN
jgi:hypothetical protein